MFSKSLFKSKTFWFNVTAAVVHFSGFIDPKYAVPVAAVGNIILRLLSSGEVTVSGS